MLQLIVLILVFAAAYLLGKELSAVLKGPFVSWQHKRAEKMSPDLDRLFMNMPAKRLMVLNIGAPLACAVMGLLLFKNFIFLLAGLIVGVILPRIVLKNIEFIRKRKFNNQLVDGLMILSGALKAGLSLIQAIENLVEEMPAPISQEFGILLREINMGVPLQDAFDHLRNRMGSEELDLIVTATLVAKETGGDLTEAFRQLVFTIRERNKLLGRMKALTVQGRLQGVIMGILPVVFAVIIFSINRDFFNIMLSENIGRMLLVYAVISEVVGLIFIRKFSKMEV